MRIDNLLDKPHYIFAFFSLLAGILLVFALPPIAGIDENQHIRRITDIANFRFLDPSNHTDDALAIWAENALVLQKESAARSPRWDFSLMFTEIQNFPATLPEDRQVKLDKNPYSISNPLMYLPFAAVLRACEFLFNPPPYVQFYILRMTGLLCSVFLISAAIARMPEHKILLAALCLLPPMLNSRSGVNIDGLVIGSIFYFLSEIFRLCRAQTMLKSGDAARLAISAFVAAQSKGAYVPLLFLLFLIPKENFSSRRARALIAVFVILPALFVSLAWSDSARKTVLSGISYFNDNGKVWPDGQFAWLSSHPFAYLQVLFNTAFFSDFFPQILREFFSALGWGHNFIAVPAAVIVLLVLLLALIAAHEPTSGLKQEFSPFKRIFIFLIIGATIAMALTMLYVQWSAYMSPIILGFQGRYLYPLLPLFTLFFAPIEGRENKKISCLLLMMFSVVSLAVTLFINLAFYYL